MCVTAECCPSNLVSTATVREGASEKRVSAEPGSQLESSRLLPTRWHELELEDSQGWRGGAPKPAQDRLLGQRGRWRGRAAA